MARSAGRRILNVAVRVARLGCPFQSMPVRRPAPHVPLSAALLIVASVAFFSATEMIVKLLTQRYPVPLLLWSRFAVQAVVMAVLFAPAMGRNLVRTPQFRLQIGRSVALIVSSVCFYNALRSLPLADATAIIYCTPVLVILLSVAVLKERITRPRGAFVAAGLVGMLLIARPGASVLQGATAFALGAAALYAVFQILTRKLHGEDPRVTLAYPAFFGAVLTMPMLLLLDYPISMSWADAGLLLLVGCFGTTGHFMFIRAFQSAPASALAPFTYTQLVWAVLFGWLVFGQLPDGWSQAGIAIIAGSGMLLAWHERRRALTSAIVREPMAVD
jgi:drug/metabolite transporter (DMT)-like permease